MLGLLVTVTFAHINFASNNTPDTAIAQPLTEPFKGTDTAGNQTMMASNDTSDLILYDNPNLGFTLEYPSNWQS